MISNSNLMVSAWDADELVGIARSMTDFHYACYLLQNEFDYNGISKMPIKLKNLDVGLGGAIVGKGIVTGEEIIEANNDLLSLKEKLKKTKYCIIDYSDATQYDVSTPEVEIIAAQDSEIAKYIPEYIVAVIAPNNLEFGVSRMWESVVKVKGLNWDTMVFKNRDDAEKWVKQKFKEKYNIDITMK